MTRCALTSTGWGVFCGCSWTWCIGMFLPIIMLDDYGWPGFAVFAIPNVLGCAAMGYVLTREKSAAMVERHGAAMRWFSLVTIAFHLFFIPFLADRFLLPGFGGLTPLWVGPGVAVVLYAVALGLSHAPTRAWPWLALVVYLVSLATFVEVGVEGLRPAAWPGINGAALAWLAPTIVFGFLLCPYLDLTFHRARRESPSRHAFTVFGATFLVMILLTVCYADRTRLPALLVAHLLAQATFTMSAHLRELREHAGVAVDAARRPSPALLILPLLAIPVVLLARLTGEANTTDLYLRWLAFYGLVFPAYVLLFIGPLRRLNQTRRCGVRYTMIVVLSLPLYELGFIHDETWVLIVPLAYLLLYAWYGGLNRERMGQPRTAASA